MLLAKVVRICSTRKLCGLQKHISVRHSIVQVVCIQYLTMVNLGCVIKDPGFGGDTCESSETEGV